VSAAAGEWRRGWQFVLLTAIGLVCAASTVAPYTIGLFVAPLQQEFGWSRAAIQGAILFSTGLGLVGGPLGAWLIDRLGLRNAIVSGVVGIALALATALLIRDALWQFYLTYSLIALFGAGTGAVAWSFLLAQRFAISRGLALGIGLSGTGLSAILSPQIAALGMDWGGWRMGYAALAAFPLLIVLPACLIILPRRTSASSRAEEQTQDGTSLSLALRGRHFWLIGASTAAIYLAVGGLITNLIPALTDKGLARSDAVSIMSVFGGAVVAGRIIVGALVDRLWAPAVATAVLLPAAAAALMLGADLDYAGYVLAAMLLGAATGMEIDMLAFLAARYFGLADFPRIYGRLYMFVAGSAGIAPLAFGHLFDRTGSYELAFTLSACLLAGGAAGLLALGRYPLIPAAR
jgi:predicted MFS family arabinose efflux permease